MKAFTPLLALCAAAAAAPAPEPPGIPSDSTARSLLDGLTVAAQGSGDDYDRDLFPHWSEAEGSCNTRELVLERDGTNVVTDDACKSTSGTWVSPYDGGEWTDAQDVDIDHMVPLSNAWKSGASSWTTDKREAFANDIEGPQLWAVTDNVNQEKSDSGPEEWKPPLEAFYCTYASSWVQVKSDYELTVTEDEKAALAEMLDTC